MLIVGSSGQSPQSVKAVSKHVTSATLMVKAKVQLLPTRIELADLPPRAIVAYAARCARRVQPRFAVELPPGIVNAGELFEAIDKCTALAEQWANGQNISSEILSKAIDAAVAAGKIDIIDEHSTAQITAHAAAHAADAARTTEANTAVAHAVAAAAAATDDVAIRAAKVDFAALKAGDFQSDDTVDATERGVCGPLWKGAPPAWYLDGLALLRDFGLPRNNVRHRRRATSKSAAPLDDLARQQMTNERNLLQRKIADAENLIRAERLEKDRSQRREEQLTTLVSDEMKAHQETKAKLLEFQQESLKLQREKEDLEGKLGLIETERDLLKVQPLSWYGKLFFRPQNIFRLVTLLVLAVMVLFALFSISEVYERQALDRWVRTKADEQRDRLAEKAVGTPANSATPQRRQEYDAIRSRLLVLSFTGATKPSETVGGIREDLLQVVLTNNDQTEATAKPANGRATESNLWQWLNHVLSYQSSDLLLSLVILFSGTVGAVVTTLRKDQLLTLRDLGQGFAAGFITFLAIRGGKSIFLLDADPLLLINPYNSAFFGLLSGMFTEMAFELLTSVAQEVATRLKGAFDPNNGNSNRSHSSPAKPPSEPPKPASQQHPTRDETTPTTAAAGVSPPG